MSYRQVTLLGAVAILGLAGGGLFAGYALLTLFTWKGGGDGLAGVLAGALLLGMLILAVLLIVPSALLLRAVSILSKAGSVHRRASDRRRALTSVAAVAVIGVWAAPAAVASVIGSAQPIEVMAAGIFVGIGLVEAATVFTAREFLFRPLGIAMLVLPLLSMCVPAVVTRDFAQSLNAQAEVRRTQAPIEAERVHYEERFAEILQGVTIDEVADEVGDVDVWRILAGGVSPMSRGQDRLDRQAAVADLGGNGVQFAFVAQCTGDFDGAALLAFADVFGNREANGDPLGGQSFDFPLVPCDGQLHLETSDLHVLPDWDDFTLAGATGPAGGWELVMVGALVQRTQPLATQAPQLYYPDSGERWLMFVAPGATAPTDQLLASVAPHLAPLRPR